MLHPWPKCTLEKRSTLTPNNMNFWGAVTLAKEVHPKLAIPMHWGMIAENTWDPEDFVTSLKMKSPQIATLVPEVGKRIIFPGRGVKRLLNYAP